MPCHEENSAELINSLMRRHYGPPEPMGQSGPVVDHTALLCSACRVLARIGYDFEENPALSQWWAKHQKEDAQKP